MRKKVWLEGGREGRTMAVETQGDDCEDELDGAKRKVEVKHVDGEPWFTFGFGGVGMWG